MPTPEETLKKREAAREVIDVLQEMALLLVCPTSTHPLSLTNFNPSSTCLLDVLGKQETFLKLTSILLRRIPI